MEINPIRLNPSVVARALGVVAFFLVLASVGGQLSKYLLGHGHVYGLVKLFYVDMEKNIPTAFSVFLLLCATLLLAFITLLKNNQKDRDVIRWAILTFGFIFMALDEAWSVHEALVKPMRGLLGGGQFGIFYFAWVIPAIAFVGVIGLFFVGFLMRLSAKARRNFLISAAVYLGGAVGFELIGGHYVELHGYESLTYSMLATIEESLEMAGSILFIYALLEYLADNYKEVRLQF